MKFLITFDEIREIFVKSFEKIYWKLSGNFEKRCLVDFEETVRSYWENFKKTSRKRWRNFRTVLKNNFFLIWKIIKKFWKRMKTFHKSCGTTGI